MTDRPVVFWTCDRDCDRLSCDTIEDAVSEWLDDIEVRQPVPDTVTVYGYARMVPDARLLTRHVMDDLYDFVDEEFGDPDGSSGDRKTPAMLEAAERFVAAFLAEYKVWACDLVETRVVKVADCVDAEDLAG